MKTRKFTKVFENKNLRLDKVNHKAGYCEWSYVLSNKTTDKVIKLNYYCSWPLYPGEVVNLFNNEGKEVYHLLKNDELEYTVELNEFESIEDVDDIFGGSK